MNELVPIEDIPALLERAAQFLVSAKTSGEVLEARDYARIAYDVAKSAGRLVRAKKAHDEVMSAVYRAQADAALIEARAQMRLADEYDAAQVRGEVAKQGQYSHGDVPAGNISTTEDIGITRKEIHEARLLRDAERASPGILENTLNARIEMGVEPTKTSIKQAAKESLGKNVRGTFGTGENEWYTPAKYIDAARKVLGVINLDPASNRIAQEKIQADKYYSSDDNGLTKTWDGKVWLNPPYAQPFIGQFMEKLKEEINGGRCVEAITLTHNYTDTKWFQDAAVIASAICFTRGRVKFYSPSGEIAAPTQGQAFMYFGKHVEKFREEFKSFGIIFFSEFS